MKTVILPSQLLIATLASPSLIPRFICAAILAKIESKTGLNLASFAVVSTAFLML